MTKNKDCYILSEETKRLLEEDFIRIERQGLIAGLEISVKRMCPKDQYEYISIRAKQTLLDYTASS